MNNNYLKISVVIVFYNMRREAIRTLYSLTTEFQKGISESEYEVIVVDSNSSEPLNSKWVESIQKNFSYQYVQSSWPTPCRAMNVGIEVAKAENVVCMIDGARILSPGVLAKMIKAESLFEKPFVQTIAMHIGEKRQNISVLEGYNQKVEDKLLATIDWQNDGYQLFNISCLANSSKDGFLSPIPESSCFSIAKAKILAIGGYDEKFTTKGGGIVNHDVLNRILEDPLVQPVMLLGEANFHQFHGGVATNVPRADHPMEDYLNEYHKLRGKPHKAIIRQPYYFGDVHEYARKFMIN
jgi:glycosyltransferase involved in cell wall biosynthesis